MFVSVEGGVPVSSALLQPDRRAPITKPTSTIRVCIRFIVGVTFTKS
jgi:hypothetical protein